MFWQFLVNAKTFYVSRIGHKRWCHTGYCYTHIPKQLSWLYGTIRHQEQGNPSDVKLGSIEKRKKIQTIKMTKFSNSIICSINEPNLWFLYALFKLSLYNCDGNKYYSILYSSLPFLVDEKQRIQFFRFCFGKTSAKTSFK